MRVVAAQSEARRHTEITKRETVALSRGAKCCDALRSEARRSVETRRTTSGGPLLCSSLPLDGFHNEAAKEAAPFGPESADAD